MPNLIRNTYYKYFGTPLFQNRQKDMDYSYPKTLDLSSKIDEKLPHHKTEVTTEVKEVKEVKDVKEV
jgi:hypothetical protein